MECHYCGGKLRNWKPTDNPNVRHGENFHLCKFNKMGADYKKSKYPSYASLAARLTSFTGWPIDMRQTPEMLSEAGFYYVGKS